MAISCVPDTPPVRATIPVLRWVEPVKDHNGVLRIGREYFGVQEMILGGHPELPGPGSRYFVTNLDTGVLHTFRLGADRPPVCVCTDGWKCRLILWVAVAFAINTHPAG